MKTLGQKLWLLLVLMAIVALPQTPEPTIRIEVKSDAGPVEGADVSESGHRVKTGPDGVAVLPATLRASHPPAPSDRPHHCR